ncbi:MAG: 1-acyl-sn-glycerol-3-phosphate acyltransferase [Gammaproteobacteria bacterium]|nr:1-acyl-sn-glycerol-3-phosphate acyltransferase [Gammaproteobacteria bacterium]
MWQNLGRGLNRAWRVFGTGLSFAVFGIGGLFLGAVVCMVMRVIIHDPEAYSQATRRLVSRAFRLFAAFMAAVGVLRWRVDGIAHWPRDRGCLVIANHPTLIDIVFLIGLFDGADCVVKAGVLRNPFWGILVRAADYVSNENPAELLDAAVRRLQAGRTVVIFPEGTRTTPGQALAFSSAASAIAVRAGCWCLPVVITCTPPTLYKHLAWYRAPAVRADFRLRVCPPWPVAMAAGTIAAQRRAAHALTIEFEGLYARELDPSLPPAALPYNAAWR